MGQCDASPPQQIVSDRLSGLHAHHHRGAFFDLPDLAKFDIFRETSHERWAETDASQVARVKSGEEEEENASEENRPYGHAERCKTQGAIELAFRFQARGRGRGSPGGSAPQFQCAEGRDSAQEK